MPLKGLQPRITRGGLPVLRLHYSADPRKNPVDGDLYPQLLKGYPGGVNDPRWKKEMEIDYGALGGTKLFPNWEEWLELGAIVIPPFDPIGYRLMASYDHGSRHPACFLVHGVDSDGRLVTLWEAWGSNIPASYVAEIMLGRDVWLPDGRRFQGNPFAGRETIIWADPSIEAKDIPNGHNPNQSTADIFLKEGVVFVPAQKGGDLTIAGWLHGHFWRDPKAPLYRITANCRQLIYEIGRQRYKDFSPKVALNRAQPEQLIDKDNDAWDALKYFLQNFPPPVKEPKKPVEPNTFGWWRKNAREGRQGAFRI